MEKRRGTKQKLEAAERLSPQQITPAQLQDLPAARRGLQSWVRRESRLRKMAPDRASILAAANAINTAFMAATSHPPPSRPPPLNPLPVDPPFHPSLTDKDPRPDTALARRKTAVCIDASSLNAWAPELEVVEWEVVRPVHPFVREFRDGDVVLGVAEVREKLLNLLPSGKVATAYADSTNAALLFREVRMSPSAVKYLATRRLGFIRANLEAESDGNAAAAAQLWQWVSGCGEVLGRVLGRLGAFNEASGGTDGGATREAFWRLSRMLCKARVRQALADGGRVHFELGDGFDYHAAASKTVPGSKMGAVESHTNGHFTASELRVVCSVVVHLPVLAERILFWEDTFPLARPADLTKHNRVRDKFARES